ncbi:GNAT family N-acetyltransferase [Haloarchaeobius sp. DFWS5]|uniref:GNAT family N-acetyltransferase n=1 Tax=Haloarchaeobius sp. DFWS5 TaxID=3446114 RepID=UPI003EBA46CE
MVDYRSLSDSDADRELFHNFVNYAFRPQEGPPAFDPDEEDDEEWALWDNRVVYGDDDEPRCVCRHYWFETTLRGVPVEMPGLSAVASPPEHRRDGNVRRMLRASLEEYDEREAPICALWPFQYSFYHKYGWDTCNHRSELSFDPEVLEPVLDGQDAGGTFRQLDADDWEAVDAVYQEMTADEDLGVDRTEDWWRHRRFEGWDDDPFVYGWERDGELRGYVFYEFESGDDGRTMATWELGHVDHEAFLACLQFCYNHDSQVSEVTLHRGVDPLFLDLVEDTYDVEITQKPGPMVRVVDVVRALETIPYAESVETTLTFDVSDPLADWNDGRFELSVEDGTGVCERLDSQDMDTESGPQPDVNLDIAALSQLVVGYHEFDRLALSANVEPRNDDARADLAALFPPQETFLRDFF